MILTSDHGFSTISKESATSYAATPDLQGRAAGPVAAGLRRDRPRPGLGLKLYDPDDKNALLEPGQFQSRNGRCWATTRHSRKSSWSATAAPT